VAFKQFSPDEQAVRYRAVYNALKALCPHRLTTSEQLALDKAVRHQLIAERAELDPTVRLRDLIHCGNLARRSFHDWQDVARARNAAQQRPPPLLSELMAGVE
jgi:hypothetical protein